MKILHFTHEDKPQDIASSISKFQDSIRSTHSELDTKLPPPSIQLLFSGVVVDRPIASALKGFFRALAVSRKHPETNPTVGTRRRYCDMANSSSNNNNNTQIVPHQAYRHASTHTSSTPTLPPPLLVQLSLSGCTGNEHLQECLEAALAYDVLETLSLDGTFRKTFSSGRTQTQIFDPPSLAPLGFCLHPKRKHAESSISPLRRYYPRHLKEFRLRSYHLSKTDLRILREGILSTKFRSNLEVLGFTEVEFPSDQEFERFAETLSVLSQEPQDEDPQEPTEYATGPFRRQKSFLRELSLVGCKLEDRHLQGLVRALRKQANLGQAQTVTTTVAAAPISAATSARSQSTLRMLDLSMNASGAKFHASLVAWLLDLDDFEKTHSPGQEAVFFPSYYHAANFSFPSRLPREMSCRCSLETLSVVGFTLSATDLPLDRCDTTKNHGVVGDGPGTKPTNQTLKRLYITEGSFVSMNNLGRFVSEHLLGLQSLRMYDCDTTDQEFTRFVTASCATSPGGMLTERQQHQQQHSVNQRSWWLDGKNLALRELYFCNTQMTSESSRDFVKLLERYPMLQEADCDIDWEQSPYHHEIDRLLRTNPAGRFLLVPSKSGTNLPIALWPHVLEHHHERLVSRHFEKICRNDCRNEDEPIQESASAIFSLLKPMTGKLEILKREQEWILTERKNRILELLRQ